MVSKDIEARWGWLKFMHIYSIVGAGGFGLGMVFVPDVIISMFKFPDQDPIVLGAFGCMLISSGILALLCSIHNNRGHVCLPR